MLNIEENAKEYVECAQCGKQMLEEHVSSFHGNYAFCSTACNLRFVGL